jgi:hypothetical protein
MTAELVQQNIPRATKTGGGGDKVGQYRLMTYEMVYERVIGYGSYSKRKVDE